MVNIVAGLLFFSALVIAIILLSDTLSMNNYFNCFLKILNKYQNQIETLEGTTDLFNLLLEKKIPTYVFENDFISKLESFISISEFNEIEKARNGILMHEMGELIKSSYMMTQRFKNRKYIYFRKFPFDKNKYSTTILLILMIIFMCGSFFAYNEVRKEKIEKLNQVGITSLEDRYISEDIEETVKGKAIHREFVNGWFNDHYYLHVMIEYPINETLKVEVPPLTYENFKENEDVYLNVEYIAFTDCLKQETEYTFKRYSLQ